MGIVFNHIRFPEMFGLVISYAVTYAVAVFFMIAGYYAFGKMEDTIKRRLIKILKIFIYAYALFFFYNILLAIKNGELGLWFMKYFNWKTPIKYILFCTVDFATPLWYLIAMSEVYVVWFFVVRGVGKECYKGISYAFCTTNYVEHIL